jgi:hypothetical protein
MVAAEAVGSSKVGAVEEEGEGMAAVGTTMVVVRDRDRETGITTTTAGFSMTDGGIKLPRYAGGESESRPCLMRLRFALFEMRLDQNLLGHIDEHTECEWVFVRFRWFLYR